MKVQFTKGPTGAFNLAYNEGDIAEVSEVLGAEIIEMGFGFEIEPDEVVIEKAVIQNMESPEKKKHKNG